MNLTGYMIQGTSYFIFPILNPYRRYDTRYKLFYFPYPETLQDMWYTVLVVLLSLSWNLTGYVIQGTSYFIFPILNPYIICDTRYKLFYFPYSETLLDMWCKVLAILFSISWTLTSYVIHGTSYFIFPILKPYWICHIMWYKVLAILVSLSWNLTWYAIQGTRYFMFPSHNPYMICDTRY